MLSSGELGIHGPLILGDMRVFPTYLQGGSAYRSYSPNSRRGSGTTRAAQWHDTAIQAIDGGQDLVWAASKP